MAAEKIPFFYFHKENFWANLTTVDIIDYDNKNPDHIFLAWTGGQMVDLYRGDPDFGTLVKALDGIIEFHNGGGI